MPTEPLGRNFSAIWLGQSVSKFGSQVTLLALPIVALKSLQAGPFEVGLLMACSSAAFFLIGLPAGVWVDRIGKRRVLIVADLVRLITLMLVPIAYAADHLSLPLLYVIAFLQGVCTVFFDVAYRSVLPAFLPREKLLAANSRLEVTSAAATAGGPALGGLLIEILKAPIALVVDALSFGVSALCTAATRFTEEPRAIGSRSRLAQEIAEGLRYVFGDPLMRAITGTTATINFFMGAFYAVAVAFLVQDIGLSAGSVGLLMSAAGAGGVVGAFTAGPITRRLGMNRTLLFSVTTGVLSLMLAPLSGSGAQLAWFAVSRFGAVAAFAVYGVAQVSYRQANCPPDLIGRMNASLRFVTFGVSPLGSLAGGAVAALGNNRAVLILVGFGSLIGPLWLLLTTPNGEQVVTHAQGK